MPTKKPKAYLSLSDRGSSLKATGLINCARCGKSHKVITMRKLTMPMVVHLGSKAVKYTYWAPCPTNKQPILFQVVGDKS